MYDSYFQRVEEKYLIKKEEKKQLLQKIDNYITKDKYFESEIHNIYFDTDNNDLIINSLNRPVFKNKYRLRSYGLPEEDDAVFLEMKCKYKKIVSKRRIKIKLKDFYNYMKKHEYDNENQIFKELDYYFNFYKLKPSIYIAYNRYSYKGKNDPSLRITFDWNLRSRRDHLKFDKNIKMDNFFDDDYYIMEIKTTGAMPIWLVRTISEMKIVPVSFSKYGKIYEKEMLSYA